MDLGPITRLRRLGGRVQSRRTGLSHSDYATNEAESAWRMYATRLAPRSLAIERQVVTTSRSLALLCEGVPALSGARRRGWRCGRTAVGRARVVRCGFSRASPNAPSFLATTLHTARLTGACSAALRANQKKQSPRGLRPTVEGWRLIATDDCQTTYENSRNLSSSGLSPAALCRVDRLSALSRVVSGGLVASLTGLC